jgi:hypothetical protein
MAGTSWWFPNFSIGAKPIKAENIHGPFDQPATSGKPAGSDLAAWVWSSQQASSILTNARSSDADKLKAAESLAVSGVTQFGIPDSDGKNRNYTIERQQIGRGQYSIQLFSQDDQGNSRIVLRGVSNEDGTYRQQRGDDGKYAGYEGSWWSQNMGHSPFAQPNGSTEAPIAVAPPRTRPAAPAEVVPPAPRPPVPHHAEIPPPPEPATPGSSTHRVIDRRRFFAVQPDQIGCGATALAMARADFVTGRPPSTSEIQQFEAETGTYASDRYPGGADKMAADARRLAGLNSRAYNYGPNQGRHAMDLLDNELAQGHAAVVWMENRNTGHGHWGYVAGKDRNGQYILADPGGSRTGIYVEHLRPVTREHLASLLDFRTGFAAVWANPTNTTTGA